MKSSLTIGPYRADVSLGCSQEEQAVLQTVHFTAKIDFESLPKGCESDQLVDSVCYAEICQTLLRICESKSFRLIEHLAHECLRAVVQKLPENCTLQIEVHKVAPPIDNLIGGASFKMTSYSTSYRHNETHDSRVSPSQKTNPTID